MSRNIHLDLTIVEVKIITAALEHFSVFHKGNPTEFIAMDLSQDIKLELCGGEEDNG